MKMALTRFCGYTFSHNPSKLKVYNSKNISEQALPLAKNIIQDLGDKACVIEGEGEFCGETCFDQYQNLLWLFNHKKTGLLSLPSISTITANFTYLSLIGEPKDNVIAYKFIFIEDTLKTVKENETKPSRHTVNVNETLWDIAYKYNIKIEKLLELNPDIIRPQFLQEESSVKLK